MALPVLAWPLCVMRSPGMLLLDLGVFRQLLRYVLVGLATNCSGYALYLLLTYMGTTPKLTMSALYATAALLGFFANRTFTFRHDGHIGGAGVRFLLAHILGYVLNLALLLVFVDHLGFAHELVQGCAIVVVAAFLFVSFRLFVFPGKRPANSGVVGR